MAGTGEKSNTYRLLVCKSYGKSTLERPSNRLEDNIKVILKHLHWESWISLVSGYGQLVGCCECGNGRSVSVKYGEAEELLGFSRRAVLHETGCLNMLLY